MNIIIINPDKENWDLRDQYSKINENIILNGIPTLEKNYNDYYTANETPSEIIPNETVLKETFIEQVGFPIYEISAEKYAIINKNRNILIQYNELWETSSINKAKMLLKYNNIEDIKELRNEVSKYEDMFIDINKKYMIFYQYLESNGYLTYESSIVARNNIANKLVNKIYDKEIEELIKINTLRLNDIDNYYESKKNTCTEIKNELNNAEDNLAKQHLKVIDATRLVSEKRILKETLKKQLENYNKELSDLQKELNIVITKVKNTNNEKIDLDRKKIELEAEISENEKEISFYQEIIDKNKQYCNKFNNIINLCQNECKETIDGLLSENNINYLNSILNDVELLKKEIEDNNIIKILESLEININSFITENKDSISDINIIDIYNDLVKDIEEKSLTCITIIETIDNNTQDKIDKLTKDTGELKNTLTKINGDLETTIKSYKIYTDKQKEIETLISDTNKNISKINEDINKNESDLEKATENLNSLSEENRNLTDKIVEISKRLNDAKYDLDQLKLSRDICKRVIDSYNKIYKVAHEIQETFNENYEQDKYDLQVMYEIQQLNEEFYNELRNAAGRIK